MRRTRRERDASHCDTEKQNPAHDPVRLPGRRRRPAQSSMLMMVAVTGLMIWFAVLAMLAGAEARSQRGALLRAEARSFESFSRAETQAFAGDNLGQAGTGIAGLGLDWETTDPDPATVTPADPEGWSDLGGWFNSDNDECAFEDYTCWQARLGPVETVQARHDNITHYERTLSIRVIAECFPDPTAAVPYVKPEPGDTEARLGEACESVSETKQRYRQRSFLQYALHADQQALPPGQRRFLAGNVPPVSLLDESWSKALRDVPVHFNAEPVQICIDDPTAAWLEAHDKADGEDDNKLTRIESGGRPDTDIAFKDSCEPDDNASYHSIGSLALLVSEAAADVGCPTDPTLKPDPDPNAKPDDPPVVADILPVADGGRAGDVYGPAYPRLAVDGFEAGSLYLAWPELPPYEPQPWMLPAFAVVGGHPNTYSPRPYAKSLSTVQGNPFYVPPAQLGHVLYNRSGKLDKALLELTLVKPEQIGTYTFADPPVRSDPPPREPPYPHHPTKLSIDLDLLNNGDVIASRWDLLVHGVLPEETSVSIISAGSIVIDADSSDSFGGVEHTNPAQHSQVALIAGCDIIIDTHPDNLHASGGLVLPPVMLPAPHWYDYPTCGSAPQPCGEGVHGDPPTLPVTATLPAPSSCSATLKPGHVIELTRVALLAPNGGVFPRLAECERQSTTATAPLVKISGTVASRYLGSFGFVDNDTGNPTGYDIHFDYPPDWREITLPWWPDPIGGEWQPIG